MWETIRAVLTSPNSLSTLIFLGLIVATAAVMTKSGLLKIHTSAVQIGAADLERNIIRQQLDYVYHHLQGLEGSLSKPSDYNEFLGKLVVEAIYDEYVNWITFNHISRSPAYIELKQNIIADIVKKMTVKTEYKTTEFLDYVRNDTKETIGKLIEIRELYSK